MFFIIIVFNYLMGVFMSFVFGIRNQQTTEVERLAKKLGDKFTREEIIELGKYGLHIPPSDEMTLDKKISFIQECIFDAYSKYPSEKEIHLCMLSKVRSFVKDNTEDIKTIQEMRLKTKDVYNKMLSNLRYPMNYAVRLFVESAPEFIEHGDVQVSFSIQNTADAEQSQEKNCVIM